VNTAVKTIADTNVLVRFLVKDDAAQFSAVCRLFDECEEIIIPIHVFCELVWVLASVYRLKSGDNQEKIAALTHSSKVRVRADEVSAGLAMMRQGGDFADGVNAYSGRQMTPDAAVFASFDQRAVRLLNLQEIAAIVPT